MAPAAGQAAGQVRGDGTLAHAALARPHGNHALGRQADFAEFFRLPRVGNHFHADRQVRQSASQVLGQLGLHPGPKRRSPSCQPQDNRQPIVFQPKLVDLFKLRNRPSRLGILELGQCGVSGSFVGWFVGHERGFGVRGRGKDAG